MSESTYALGPGQCTEHGRHVGYTLYTITGQRRLGETTLLCVVPQAWGRTLDDVTTILQTCQARDQGDAVDDGTDPALDFELGDEEDTPHAPDSQ